MRDEEIHGLSNRLLQHRRYFSQRMLAPERVTGPFHQPKSAGVSRKLCEKLRLRHAQCLVGGAVQNEPRHFDARGCSSDIERAVTELLDFSKNVEAKWNRLPGAGVRNVDVAALAPLFHHLRWPPVGARDCGPRHESLHTRIPRRLENCNPASSRMPEKPIAIVDPVESPRLGNYFVEILELLEVSVARERTGIREILPVRANAAAGKIERDRAKSRGREFLCEIGKEGESGEALEAVTDHDRRFCPGRNSHLTAYRERRVVAALTPELETLEFHSTSPPASTQPLKPPAIDATSS